MLWNMECKRSDFVSSSSHHHVPSHNHLHESISISYTPLLSFLNHVVVSFFPNLSTRPSTKMAGPLGISPLTALLASSSKLGSSSNVHSSSPPYALGRFCASMRVHSVGPASLPRTYILFRVPSSNQPCVSSFMFKRRADEGERERDYLDPPPNGRKVRRRVDDDDHPERFWVICRCEAGGFLEVMPEFPDG